MKNLINCALIIVAGVGTCAAQTISSNSTTNVSSQQFVQQASLSGMKEVATGKIAMQKAQNSKLKAFGTMMTQDHGKANAELMALAKSKNIQLPTVSGISGLGSGNDQTTGSSTTMGTTGNTSGNSTSSSTGTSGATGSTGSGNVNVGNTTSNPTGTSGSTGNTGSGNMNTSSATTNNMGTNGAMGSTGTSGNVGMNNNTNSTNAGTSSSNRNNTTGNVSSTGAMQGNGNMASPKTMTEADVNSAIQQLNGLTGTAFDAAYAQMMVMDHQNAIALFEQGSRSTDPDVKAFATKHLPTLRNHLQQITTINSSLGGRSGTKKQ